MKWGARALVSIDLVAGLAMIAASAVVIWSQLTPRTRASRAPALEGKLVSFDGAPSKGSATARIGMIVFSDYECPFCRVFAKQTGPEFEASYVMTGLVRMALRQLPLVTVHSRAYLAAQAAACAHLENQFWSMHDLLFEAPKQISDQSVRDWGTKLQLSPAWNRCVQDGKNLNVDQDLELAKTLGIESTPMFLIGPIEGNQHVRVKFVVDGLKPLPYFAKILEGLKLHE